MKYVGYGVAALGTAYVVKQIRRRKESSRGWHKIKVGEEKPASATAPHETQVKEERRTGTRYGSNPLRY
ncbi:hypothetical protein SAMN02910340_02006 [Methanosarcina thermophila]|jgi:hypothetical protein|nr:hypothetical protein SAMN02910340_02006 [Methanosarcina thermophila]